ncbi:tetratricopeptide repeat protein [Aquirufa ecclesiirivi]
MAEKLGIPELQYQSYTEVIRGAIFAGLFDVGALYMNKYLDLAELENNEKMIGRATANLGLLHMFLGDLNQADSLFNKGLTLVQHYAKEHHEEVSLEDQINTFLDLGHIYLGKKQIDKAEKFYLKGLSLSRNKMEFQLVSAQLAQSLGILYTQQNQKEKAKAYLDLALSQQKLLNNHSMISSCYMSLGEFSDKFNLEGESLIYFQKGLALAQKSESVELISSISDRLYEIFQKQGNSSLALKYLKMNLDAKAKMKSEQAKESLFRKSFARNIIKNEEAEKLK